MKFLWCLIAISMFRSPVFAQRVQVGLFGGASAYSGDIVSKTFPGHKETKGAFGFTLNYQLTDQIVLRGGITFAAVAGADSLSNNTAQQYRNLSFQSSITEFNLLGEYYVFNLYDQRYSPYFFAGLAVYHFDPFAYNLAGNKIFLKPLSTEGEGINGYPDRRPYSLTQLAIPFGGGLKFVINDNLRIGVELGMRKLFTDYLDDVSKSYIDQTDLFNARGGVAVQISYRSDELPNGNPAYPAKDQQRGNNKKLDWYYIGGIHLTYLLGGESRKNSGFSRKRKSRMGCPANPM